jgi:hypothetical protein
MRSLILSLIDLAWLLAALGLLVWGIIIILRQRSRWRRGLGFMVGGGLLLGARFMDFVWRVLHQWLGS